MSTIKVAKPRSKGNAECRCDRRSTFPNSHSKRNPYGVNQTVSICIRNCDNGIDKRQRH